MKENNFISKYSNNKPVSAAQYITELICENKAKKDKSDLHYRFWVSKKWDLYYRNQIASAHKLLKEYDAKAIIAALRDNDSYGIYSLRAPHLKPIIDKHAQILSEQNTDLTLDINRDLNKTHRKTQQSKSTISKLKELDDES
jgi:hypothetical protein